MYSLCIVMYSFYVFIMYCYIFLELFEVFKRDTFLSSNGRHETTIPGHGNYRPVFQAEKSTSFIEKLALCCNINVIKTGNTLCIHIINF